MRHCTYFDVLTGQPDPAESAAGASSSERNPGKQLLAFYLLFGSAYLKRVIGYERLNKCSSSQLPISRFQKIALLFILQGSSCGLVSTNERELDRAKDLHRNKVIIV